MKINLLNLFYFVFIIFLLHKRVVFSFQESTKLCNATFKNQCTLTCCDKDLKSENEILKAEEKTFYRCKLILKRCTSTNQTNEFLEDTTTKFEDLRIIDSTIDLNKLSLQYFPNLKRLLLKNTTTKYLHSEKFLNRPGLRKFQLQATNHVNWVEKGFLRNLSLDCLQIQGINLSQKKTIEFFLNLTGGFRIPSIRKLDWSHNNFGNFTRDLLFDFPNLRILKLTNCRIFNFDVDAYKNKKINVVYINQNNIRELPEKRLRPLMEKVSFVSIKENNLTCDCEMKWLQNLVKKQKWVLKNFNGVKCASPEGVLFMEANMCLISENFEKVSSPCSSSENGNLWSDMKSSDVINETPRKLTVTKDEPGVVEITISNAVDSEKTYLWYGMYANTTPRFNCMKILQSKVTIQVTPDVNYLICLAQNFKLLRIDDCLPFKTKPLYENQTWLTKKSISLSVTSICLVVLFALATGALILYLSVRKNPSLIRGSKRVIEVKRHDKAQILIMPRGYDTANPADNSSLALINPQRPLELSRSSLSCDTISTVSYVSANQPTQLEILTYRLNRLRELFQRNSNLPPSVASLPMQIATPINRRLPPNVDLLFEYEWYTITTTTTQI